MAVTTSVITSGISDTDATSYSTASVTPAANKVHLLFVYSRKTGDSTSPTVTGCGMTWTEITSATVPKTDSGNSLRHCVFRAIHASPSTGSITIDYGAKTQILQAWALIELTNTKTSGTNGADAIVQAVGAVDEGASNTGITVTLAAFADANNATIGATRAGNTVTPGSGFTELAENSSTDVPYHEVEFKDTNDTSVDWTWSSTTSFPVAIALEIAFEAPASSIKTWDGLAAASIKTHNGLAVASRKTWNGLA